MTSSLRVYRNMYDQFQECSDSDCLGREQEPRKFMGRTLTSNFPGSPGHFSPHHCPSLRPHNVIAKAVVPC